MPRDYVAAVEAANRNLAPSLLSVNRWSRAGAPAQDDGGHGEDAADHERASAPDDQVVAAAGLGGRCPGKAGDRRLAERVPREDQRGRRAPARGVVPVADDA